MSEKVDFVYIDPPFATTNIFLTGNGKATAISSSSSGNLAYEDSLTGKEYLEYIRERLIMLKMLMSDNSSIYFHIDYKIGHYVKILMDEIFGKECFINDIARIKIRTTKPLLFDRYERNRETGSLIIIDEASNETVGAAMII